jgi:hypothetical protein
MAPVQLGERQPRLCNHPQGLDKVADGPIVDRLDQPSRPPPDGQLGELGDASKPDRPILVREHRVPVQQAEQVT